MVSAPLHVESSQVQRHLKRELEKPVPQLIMHHAVLRVQLGSTTNQAPQDWIQAT